MVAPNISLITAVYNPPRDAFEETVASVLGQSVSTWEWVLSDDCSPAAWVRPRLRELAAGDNRIRVVERSTNGGIVAASNSALAEARGEFVALLDHDDVLAPNALAAMLAAAESSGDEPVDYVYSDQDKMTEDGRRHEAFRKPDWSPERLRHHMYTSHFSLYRREVVEQVGGFRAGFDGSQDHDLVLRVSEVARRIEHVPEVLYHWRQVEGSAAASTDAKPYAWDAGVRAVQDHLDRVGIKATASRGRYPGLYRVDREPDLTTSVSVIIPTIGTSAVVWGKRRILVTETIRSVIRSSKHLDLEFVVVYDTPTPAPVLDSLQALRDLGARIKLVEFTEPFNFSTKCNVGAINASGDVLVFLNDDMEASSDGLIEQLIAPLAEPGVGATGARLLFETTQVQHAGVVYGDGMIHHSYYKALRDDPGIAGELTINREVSALTGACIAVRRKVFDEVGGFCETLPVNFNDVDLCLKIRRSGRRLLWLVGVELFHFESITRDPVVRRWEVKALNNRWGSHHALRECYAGRHEDSGSV